MQELLVLSVIGFLIALIGRLLLEEELKPAAPRERRGRAIFRQCFIGTDLCLLALGLFFSEGLLAAVPSPSPEVITGAMQHLMISMLLLLATLFLWGFAGDDKFIPISEHETNRRDAGGQLVPATRYEIHWRDGFFSRAGVCVLCMGNVAGALSVGTYLRFLVLFGGLG